MCGRQHITTQPLFAAATGRHQYNEADERVVPAAEADELRVRAEQAEQRASQVEAERAAREERQALFEQQHILQVQGLLFDVGHWQSSFERSEETVRTQRDRIRALEASEQQASSTTKRLERLERRYERVKTDQSHLRESMQSTMDKNLKVSWAANKLVIRNYPITAIQRPQDTITALLLRLRIPAEAADFEIVRASPLTNEPEVGQITIACNSQRLKAEILGSQTRAREHRNPEINRLSFVDPVDTRQLQKRASAKLIAQTGVASLRMEHGILLVQPISGDPYEEITDDQQIEDLARRLAQRAPSKAKRKRDQRKRMKNQSSSSPAT